MKWVLSTPNKGDIVRVVIKNNIYHYGIYIGDSTVIEYGSQILDTSENVKVQKSTIADFAKGKFVECSSFSFMEKLKKNSPEKTVELATKRLGENKYNLLENNCEHFVNECVFNKHILFK